MVSVQMYDKLYSSTNDSASLTTLKGSGICICFHEHPAKNIVNTHGQNTVER